MIERIVQGIVYKGEIDPNQWEVRTWISNGVMERSARPVVVWEEQYSLPIDYQFDPIDPVRDAALIAEQKERSQKSAARRAKTTCRRFIISEGFNEMLTLTYRENQPDRELCKVHFKEWVRRMKRALGGFRYCASFEVQERGSMHVHCATHKLPAHAIYKGVKVKAWQLGTKIWRSIVGDDNGLCFVGGAPSKFGKSRRKNMSLAKMASYVSKYILKDFAAAPDEKNRYSRSNGQVIAEVHTMRLCGSAAEIIACCFELSEGDCIVSHNYSKWGDSWWLCTERIDPNRVQIVH